jgi:hypothetical protein
VNKDACWIETFTGRRFYLLEPTPEQVFIEDIAHALANQCRFTGHVRRFYSVAEHSWHVSHICKVDDSRWGLLHDAAEAYICDLSRPLKHCSDLGVLYQQTEVKIMNAVRERFNLSNDQPESVHNADRAMLLREKQELLTRLPWGSDKAAWDAEGLAVDREIHCWNPDVAEEKFLRRFKDLYGN